MIPGRLAPSILEESGSLSSATTGIFEYRSRSVWLIPILFFIVMGCHEYG